MLRFFLIVFLSLFTFQANAKNFLTLVNIGGSVAIVSAEESVNPKIIQDLAVTKNGSCVSEALKFDFAKLSEDHKPITQIAFLFDADINQVPTHVSPPRIVLKFSNGRNLNYIKQLAPGECDLADSIKELIEEYKAGINPGFPPAQSKDPEIRIRRSLGITI